MTSDKVDYDWGYMIWWLDDDTRHEPNISSAKMVVHPGKKSENHLHNNCFEFLIVNSGEIEVIVNDRSTTLRKDDTILINPNTEHHTLNTGSIDAELTIIYSESPRNYTLC